MNQELWVAKVQLHAGYGRAVSFYVGLPVKETRMLIACSQVRRAITDKSVAFFEAAGEAYKAAEDLMHWRQSNNVSGEVVSITAERIQ